MCHGVFDLHCPAKSVWNLSDYIWVRAHGVPISVYFFHSVPPSSAVGPTIVDCIIIVLLNDIVYSTRTHQPNERDMHSRVFITIRLVFFFLICYDICNKFFLYAYKIKLCPIDRFSGLIIDDLTLFSYKNTLERWIPISWWLTDTSYPYVLSSTYKRMT